MMAWHRIGAKPLSEPMMTQFTGAIWHDKATLKLTHWGWVMHICFRKVTIISSDTGLLLGQRQATTDWVSAGHSHHRKTRIGPDICENWVANFRRFGECKMPMQQHTNTRITEIWQDNLYMLLCSCKLQVFFKSIEINDKVTEICFHSCTVCEYGYIYTIKLESKYT